MADHQNQGNAAASKAIRNLLGVVCLSLAFLALTPRSGSADQVSDGFAAYQRGDYLAAFGLCRPLAERGNGDAAFIIGLMYATGRGVRQSYAEAAQWYQVAADDGQDVAENNLGLMYASGVGVPKSDDQAARLYWLAADQGNPRAQYNLAAAYRDGKGVEQNDVRAYMWYTLSTAADRDPEIRERAGKERDELAKKMSSAQVDQAQAAAADWKPTIKHSTWPRPPRSP